MWLLLISILGITLQMIFLMMMISIDNVEHYQGNIILRKFNMCSLGVKLTLFPTYCSPMYTAQLWWNYKHLPLLHYKLLFIFLNVSCQVQI